MFEQHPDQRQHNQQHKKHRQGLWEGADTLQHEQNSEEDAGIDQRLDILMPGDPIKLENGQGCRNTRYQ